MALFLGLDIGTTGAKGLLVREDGTVIATSTHAYPLLTPRPGWAEQDPQVWWSASVVILQTLADAAAEPIAAIGLTGQMHGAVFLDARGEVLRPALTWNDQRTARECTEIEERVGAARLRAITGNAALTGFQAPKILWLRNNEPELYARVESVLLPKDYIRFRLTGDRATDASDASGTLLLDLRRRNWSEELLAALDIPGEWLPRVYEGPECTGVVSAEAAAATGLLAGTHVVAGGGDNAAGAVGAGVVDGDEALLSLGTSGVVFADSERPLVDPTGALHGFAHAVPGRYHVMGVMLAAGGSLRWYRDTLGSSTYDALLEEAANVPAGSDRLTFLPYLAGERTPHMNPYARGTWFGLTLAHGRPHLVRSILEGVAFGLRDSLVRIEALGIDIRALRVIGNGMRNPVWRRIVCDVVNRPLRRLQVEEGPAFGAAILASVGAGAHATVGAAVEAMVRVSPECDVPDAGTQPAYAAAYEQFGELYAALHPLMKGERQEHG